MAPAIVRPPTINPRPLVPPEMGQVELALTGLVTYILGLTRWLKAIPVSPSP